MSQSCEVALSILEFEKAGKPFEVNGNFLGLKIDLLGESQ